MILAALPGGAGGGGGVFAAAVILVGLVGTAFYLARRKR